MRTHWQPQYSWRGLSLECFAVFQFHITPWSRSDKTGDTHFVWINLLSGQKCCESTWSECEGEACMTKVGPESAIYRVQCCCLINVALERFVWRYVCCVSRELCGREKMHTGNETRKDIEEHVIGHWRPVIGFGAARNRAITVVRYLRLRQADDRGASSRHKRETSFVANGVVCFKC